MNNPIVVGTDGSQSALRAVEWAAGDAARRRHRLHIVHAVQPWSGELRFAAEVVDALTDAGESILADAADRATKVAPGIVVTTELVYDAPGLALRQHGARACEVVVGHRGLGGFAGLLLGSTSLRVAGRTPCPVIVVRGEAREDHHEVLAGVDESPGVLEYAFETASLRGSWLRAVHAWQVSPTLLNGAYSAIIRGAFAAAEERLARSVAPWRAKYPDVKVVEEVPSGHPVDELVDRSGRSDLLVVGTGRGPGSVTHGVIHHADCPVAVIGE